jgi:HAD superfamily hydrolase (TIGR01450 family)
VTVPGTVVFDLDGVVYRGKAGIEGAGDALWELSNAGWKLIYATNNASESQHAVARKISTRSGYNVATGDVVTSAMAAARFMKGRYSTTYVVGADGLRSEMTNAGIAVVDGPDAQSVVVGIHFDLTYRHIANASEAIRNGAAFIATNTDATYPTSGGRLAPGAGAVVAAIATASGTEPIVCGKPHPAMGNMIQELAEGEVTWMVGDRLESDIELAKNHGWRSILPLTGVTTSLDDVPPDRMPDHVVDSIADVPGIVMNSDSGGNLSV